MRHFHSRVYLLLCLLAKKVQLSLKLLREAKVSFGWTEQLLLDLVIPPLAWLGRVASTTVLPIMLIFQTREQHLPLFPFTVECLISVRRHSNYTLSQKVECEGWIFVVTSGSILTCTSFLSGTFIF